MLAAILGSVRRSYLKEMARVLSIVNVDQEGLERVLQETSSVLRNGGVVAIPTDTIYGVASLVSSNKGVERIYQMKGRQREKPLAICVSNVDQIYKWGKVTVPSPLLSLLLPGPVTTVFERQPELNPALNPGVPLVGLRIPDHQFVCHLVEMCGGPLALTSANISKTTSTLSILEFQDLWPSLDLVVDGGIIGRGGGGGGGEGGGGGGGKGEGGSEGGRGGGGGGEGGREGGGEGSRLGSTVVDLSQSGSFTIIRPGMHHQQTVVILRDQYNLKEVVT